MRDHGSGRPSYSKSEGRPDDTPAVAAEERR